jgi:hypothetical protein
MAVFCVPVSFLDKPVQDKMKVVLSHTVKNFLEPSQPAEGLFCDHQVGFWPILFDLLWGIQSLTFWSLGKWNI